MNRRAARCRGESGQAAGLETIPLGFLVFIAGTLLVLNGWAIVTNRSTADSIAREYLRAYTKAETRPDGLAAGRQAADAVAAAHNLRPDRVRIEQPTAWGPCEVATLQVTLTVPAVRMPFIDGLGTTEVVVSHRDRIDAYRAGIPKDGAANACT